ncbi:MAG TPA: HAD family hydrolase [Saprospiraceae bacterium]|nr:HAD family hydrolase [Saprospiraceae bacterium]
MKREIDLVIFDCDGTLVDSEPISRKVVIELLDQYGIHMHPDLYDHQFAGTQMLNIYQYAQEGGIPIDMQTFEDQYRARLEELLVEEVKPIEGAHQLLQTIQHSYCIASNGPKRKMKVTLEACRLKSYFPDHTIHSAYDIEKWKPEPDLFLHAAQVHGVSEEKCLVIEDTIHGIQAARAAGMAVWGVNIKNHRETILKFEVPIYTHLLEVKRQLESRAGLWDGG